MPENVTIVIPDISGYTEFLTKTELVHGAHIINELLEVIIESNDIGLLLSEVEGDAALFYKKGEPIEINSMLQLCIKMFQKFHSQLRIIDRDTICQCGACQTVTSLNLKFIIHFGMIKEIKVSNFTKAAGLDMIIAHRLLKNKINSNEYILITSNYHKHFNKIELQLNLNWQQSSENYPAIGEIVYRYALLDEVRRNIPYPPKRILPVIELGEFTAKVRINDSMKNVYSKLIDLDERINWMVGLDKLERDEVTERVGLGHTCYIQGDTIEFIIVKSEIKDKEIIYAEDGKLGELGLQIRNTYYFKSISKNVTSVELDLKCIEQKKPSEELLSQIMKRARANLERFKEYCERQN